MRPTKEETAFWYKKLKESGFNDIENPVTGALMGDNACPKPIFSKLTASSGFITRMDRYLLLEPYYRLCRLFLYHNKEWESDIEKEIWRLHAEECMGRGKIVRTLKIPEYRVRKALEKLKKRLLDFDPDSIQDREVFLKVVK
jgi:hypothetical protein